CGGHSPEWETCIPQRSAMSVTLAYAAPDAVPMRHACRNSGNAEPRHCYPTGVVCAHCDKPCPIKANPWNDNVKSPLIFNLAVAANGGQDFSRELTLALSKVPAVHSFWSFGVRIGRPQ